MSDMPFYSTTQSQRAQWMPQAARYHLTLPRYQTSKALHKKIPKANCLLTTWSLLLPADLQKSDLPARFFEPGPVKVLWVRGVV